MDSVDKKGAEVPRLQDSKESVYQDNQTTIKLEENEMKSSGDRTRHINIRYFFTKDIFSGENIKVQHRSTKIMILDYLTKSLQGGVFRRMRDTIMGLISFPACCGK